MIRSRAVRSICAALLTVALGGASLAAVTFEDLLEEGSLELVLSDDFMEVPLEPNPVFAYERAVRHRAAALEIRYAVRPIARASVEYEDPHNAAPDPNHLYAMMFRTLVDELAGGGDSPLREYPADQARTMFNADWAAASTFDLAPEFSQSFRQGLLLAIHKNNKADAYVVFLFDDYADVKDKIKSNLSSLLFRNPG